MSLPRGVRPPVDPPPSLPRGVAPAEPPPPSRPRGWVEPVKSEVETAAPTPVETVTIFDVVPTVEAPAEPVVEEESLSQPQEVIAEEKADSENPETETAPVVPVEAPAATTSKTSKRKG